jgi:Fe-S cluster assembly protein SufD
MRVASADTSLELPAEARAAGVVFAPLRDVAEEARERLYSVVKADEWKYLALNAALWDAGAFVYVPKGVEVALPLQMLTTGASAPDAAMFTRTLVVAEAHSRVELIDDSASANGQRAFVSGAVEIVLGDGAQVDYYDVNRWGDGVYNFKTVRAILGRDARFTAVAAGIGSKLTKMRIDTEMPQPGADAKLLGVTFGNDDQHFDYNTLQNHTGNHTISDLQFKSALTDSASLVWYGITRINPTAGGSEANQTSRNMLLSDHAKASPIPILEIQAYDVSKCSHGATAGPVDENELFYLQARAIPRNVAEQMLVEGFFADVIARIPSEQLRSRVTDAIIAKAGGKTATLSAEEVLSS